MSSVSTWSLLLKRILQFAHQEEGVWWRHDDFYYFFDGPVLKGAPDHATHWRKPGF